MSHLKGLIRGEFERLMRYRIIQVGFMVSVLWLLVMFLIGREEARAFIPLFIFMDAALMTVMLIGAGLFYERQENTLKSMMASPATMAEIIFSKLISAVYIAIQSAVFLGLFAYFFFDASINFAILIPFIVIIALAHAMIGYAFSVLMKDFPTLLAATMMYMIVFGFPTIFYSLDILGDGLETVLMFSPTHASMLMIEFSFGEAVSATLIVIGVIYLLVVAFVLGRYVVFPKYIEKAIKE